jgi:hypothetical protein
MCIPRPPLLITKETSDWQLNQHRLLLPAARWGIHLPWRPAHSSHQAIPRMRHTILEERRRTSSELAPSVLRLWGAS